MHTKENLKVLIVASEVAPYAKTGGLGDVAGSLPKELKELGADVRVVMPKYKAIPQKFIEDAKFLNYFEVHLAWRNQSASIHQMEKDTPIYFIENDYYFGRDQIYSFADDNERYAFFSKAVLEMLPVIDFKPDVIHLNDWQTGPIALMLSEIYNKVSYYANMKTLFTIHNLQYQGVFPIETLYLMNLSDYYFNADRLEFYGQISYMKAGLKYANAISTVSKTYAQEIQTSHYGYGLDGVLRERKEVLRGIINGIDTKENNPATDKRIFANFSVDDIEPKYVNKAKLQQELNLPVRDVPVIGIISRLADQKGFDIIAYILEDLMHEDIQLVVLGTGDGRYEYMFNAMSQRYPDKLSANLKFDGTLAQKIYAGTDMFLMPSLFEPCGLGQIISMRYGSVPIVRKTGGLADTVTHYNSLLKEGNGFVFEDYNGSALMSTIRQAIDLYNQGKEEWQPLVENAMNMDFSWKKSAKEYIKQYQDLSKK